jgi:hypothetical protein
MAHKTASIWKYVHTTNGWRYCKPVMRANSKIDPRRVFVGGNIEEYPLEHWMGGSDGPKNIWFEPHAGRFGSFAKDKVGTPAVVCVKKTMTLDQAKTDYLKGWTRLLPQK